MLSIDIRKALIPFSLLKITNAFKRMKPDETMEIIASDAAVALDLQRLFPETGAVMITSRVMNDDGPAFRLELKKVTPPTPKPQKGESTCPKSI